jgi:hypothetical protein
MLWKKIFTKRYTSGANEVVVIPDGAERLPDLIIGGKSPKKLEKEFNYDAKGSKGFAITESARQVLLDPRFTTLPKKRKISLIKITLKDLNLHNPTMEEIITKAKELGLGLCPAEVGPQLRLATRTSEWLNIVMEPIGSYVFVLTTGASTYNNTWLDVSLSSDNHIWETRDKSNFVFAINE